MIIDSFHDTAALRRLWKQAFGDPDTFLDAFFSNGFSPDRCRALTLDGQLTAALYWFDCSWQSQKIAYLYAVATDKAFQGQGLCRALMEDTHRHLAELGYQGAILVPGSKALFRLYEKLGYRTCCHIGEFTCDATAPTPLRPLDAAEYALLRRRYLLENAVVQEGPLLTFLQTQARFYAGDDFLLCAALDGETLTVPELLGNTSAAPAITAALGARQGRFRAPGKDKSFAVYHALTSVDTVPTYFGLALD